MTGPTWAAAFAVGTHIGASPRDIVTAFVFGFEVGGRLGSDLGLRSTKENITTAYIWLRLGVVIAASILYGSYLDQLKNAIGLASTEDLLD